MCCIILYIAVCSSWTMFPFNFLLSYQMLLLIVLRKGKHQMEGSDDMLQLYMAVCYLS